MHESNSSNNLYSIQFVSNVTGINPHTIRAWEKRYGATTPVRDKNGRRMYSDQEIQRLDTLNKLVEIGNSISDIANLEKGQLDLVLEKYNERTKVLKKGKKSVSSDFDWASSLENILASIKLRKINTLVQEFQKCEKAMDSVEFLNKMFIPILNLTYKIFEEEEYDGYSHTLTLTIKSKLIRMLILLNSKSISGKRVLISSGLGELNELGALASAVVFSAKGYCVNFVGINSSAQTILSMKEALKPEIVFLSLGYSTTSTISTSERREFLSEITIGNMGTEIFVGGFNDVSTYNGFDVEIINNFEVLSSILEST